jgi:DnaJ-class molecular chaperone
MRRTVKNKIVRCPICRGSGFDRISEQHAYHTCEVCVGVGQITEKEYDELFKEKRAVMAKTFLDVGFQ